MNRKILITGASRGLGLALTEKLLEGGDTVHAVIRRESQELLRLQDGFPERLKVYEGDVRNEESIQQALQNICTQTSEIDILLNNAAVHLEQNHPLLEQVDFLIYLPTFQVNVLGPLMMAKYALPLIRKGTGKLIVNISSGAGSIGTSSRKSEYSYCMSKAALNMASRIMQNDLKTEKIKVLSLVPGWFSSDMGGPNAPMTPSQAAERIVKLILNPPDLEGPIYVDSSGIALEW
jgi:NAD(P)-dependent dehydrogenase (short-subunit alcohol dehydrogenase family)